MSFALLIRFREHGRISKATESLISLQSSLLESLVPLSTILWLMSRTSRPMARAASEVTDWVYLQLLDSSAAEIGLAILSGWVRGGLWRTFLVLSR